MDCRARERTAGRRPVVPPWLSEVVPQPGEAVRVEWLPVAGPEQRTARSGLMNGVSPAKGQRRFPRDWAPRGSPGRVRAPRGEEQRPPARRSVKLGLPLCRARCRCPRAAGASRPRRACSRRGGRCGQPFAFVPALGLLVFVSVSWPTGWPGGGAGLTDQVRWRGLAVADRRAGGGA